MGPQVVLLNDAPADPVRIQDLKQAFGILCFAVSQNVFPLFGFIELGADGLLRQGKEHHRGLEFRLDEKGGCRTDECANETGDGQRGPPCPDAAQEGFFGGMGGVGIGHGRGVAGIC